MNTTHSLMTQALALWVKITGIEPGRSNATNLGSWRIQSLHEALQEALELDVSEVTAYYLLSRFSTDYFASRQFSVEALMNDPEGVASYLSHSHELKALLNTPQVIADGEAFAQGVTQAVKRYDALSPAVQTLIANRHDIGFLRRDALRSIKNLRVDQFLRGEPEPEGRMPVYNKRIHQFINVNSLLQAAIDMPAGVSLNLIRHPDGYQSYFVFTVRNGGNLFFLSDTPSVNHPLQGEMMSQRRPDKQLAGRMAQNWFPYDLLDIDYNDNGDLYVVPEYMKGKTTTLAPYQSKLHPLKFIKELGPNEVVWLSMMFDLIIEKFWRQGHQAPALSYTGEMLKVASPLAAKAEENGFSLALYEPLSLAPLVLDDVLSGSAMLTGETVGKHTGANAWLEARFKDRVARDIEGGMDLLNLAGLPEVTTYLASTPAIKALEEVKRDVRLQQRLERHTASGESGTINIASDGHADEEITANEDNPSSNGAETSTENSHGIVNMTARDTQKLGQKLGHFGQRDLLEATAKLAKIDVTRFGTRESIGNDRVFIARHNVAKRVQQLAEEEFTARKTEIQTWVRGRMRANVAALFPLIALGKILKPVVSQRWGTSDSRRRFMEVMPVAEIHNRRLYGTAHAVSISGPGSWKSFGPGKNAYTCCINDSKASFAAIFEPHTADELAMLCGCTVAELPDVLQHWTPEAPTSEGNQILTRQDPMDWVVSNPWSDLKMLECVYLSTRVMNEIKKKHPASAQTGGVSDSD